MQSFNFTVEFCTISFDLLVSYTTFKQQLAKVMQSVNCPRMVYGKDRGSLSVPMVFIFKAKLLIKKSAKSKDVIFEPYKTSLGSFCLCHLYGRELMIEFFMVNFDKFYIYLDTISCIRHIVATFMVRSF